jgi:hypothetical protein
MKIKKSFNYYFVIVAYPNENILSKIDFFTNAYNYIYPNVLPCKTLIEQETCFSLGEKGFIIGQFK